MRIKLIVAALVALLVGVGVAYAATVASAPQHLQAQSGVLVRWDPVPGAVSYQVKRLSGAWETLGTTKATSYVDESPPPGELTYQVRGIAKGGAWGPRARVSVTSPSVVVTYTQPSATITVPGPTKTVTVTSTVAATGTAPSPTTDPPITTPTNTTPTGTTPDPPASGVLFADDFNGPAGADLNSSKWGRGNGNSNYGDINLDRPVTLDGAGHAVLTGTPSEGSARETRGKFGFLYGTVSAWIKMPAAHGYWPAFWMLNGSQSGSEADIAETDIVETYTTWACANQTSHMWHLGNNVWDEAFKPGCDVDLSAGFHKYSAKLEPGKVSYYFDDHLSGVVSSSDHSPWTWGPNVTRDHWLILGLALGGQQPMPSSNGSMLVDRVEVTS